MAGDDVAAPGMLRDLLAGDGSIWVSIDDNAGHYLKVVMDEVFERGNLIANFVWQRVYTIRNSAKYLSDMHDHVLCYARSKLLWSPNFFCRASLGRKKITPILAMTPEGLGQPRQSKYTIIAVRGPMKSFLLPAARIFFSPALIVGYSR